MAEQNKKKRGANLLIYFLMLVCLAVGGYSAWQIVSQKMEDRKAKNVYDQVAEQAVVKDVVPQAVEVELEGDTQQIPLQTIDFEALWELNEDVAAWLELPGTVINYPVAQGVDNDQYLRHLLDGSYHRFGTLFIDYRNSRKFLDDNTIIYGHHIKAGDMFCILENYREQSYYDEHPYFILYTPEKNYLVELFAGNLVDGNIPIPLTFGSDEEFQSYIDEIRADSTFVSEVEMTPQDRMVTFYTCAYDFEDAKYVLRGKLAELPQ